MISSNKFVKSDFDDLEKLCQDLNKEIADDQALEKEKALLNRRKTRQSTNVFKKAEVSEEN